VAEGRVVVVGDLAEERGEVERRGDVALRLHPGVKP
jgi:hypothetical protein